MILRCLVKIVQNALTKGTFLCKFIKFLRIGGNESHGVYEVIEIESIIKIGVAPFLVALGPISAQNLGITRERWVVQAQGCFHRPSSRILNKDREPRRKFYKRENCSKSTYYSKGFFFFGQFIKFLEPGGNDSNRGSRGRRFRIRH